MIKKSGIFEGPAFIQPIRAIWKVFKKLWLKKAGPPKKPLLFWSCKQAKYNLEGYVKKIFTFLGPDFIRPKIFFSEKRSSPPDVPPLDVLPRHTSPPPSYATVKLTTQQFLKTIFECNTKIELWFFDIFYVLL